MLATCAAVWAIASLWHSVVSAGEIAYNDVRATAVREGKVLHIEQHAPRRMRVSVEAEDLVILVDGVYTRSHDGKLMLLIEERAGLDPVARDLLQLVENATVEAPIPIEGIPLAQALALHAQLDANPQTVFDWLVAQGVLFHDARQSGQTVDPSDPAVAERAIAALNRLSRATAARKLSVAGTASTLLLGFPPDDTSADGKAALHWPADPMAWLTLAPVNGSLQAMRVDPIGRRLLSGAPSWFSPVGATDEALVACLPFEGCGYIPSGATRAVAPLWIAFDRQTLAPHAVYLD